MSRLPLDLYAEVTTATDARYRWDANQAPGSRLRNASFRTKIGEGFSDGGGQLARRIDLDYPDLGLVNTVTFVGADGTVAYEGRLSAMPRELSDAHSIGVTLAGWMAHAKDKRFTEIYVDRSSSGWVEGSLTLKAARAAASVPTGKIPASSGNGGLSWTPPNESLPDEEMSELFYDCGPGLQATILGYRGTRTGAFTNFEAPTLFGGDVETSLPNSASLTLDGTTRAATITASRILSLRVRVATGPVTPAVGHLQQFDKLAVYGNHTVNAHFGETDEPAGYFASDVLKDIANRFCPQLDTSGVEDTGYVIQHLAFRDRTFPYDAFLELNKYHLWHLGVWENKTLVYRPYDLSDYDWEIRTDDQGTTFSPQGPSTEDLFNGMAVTYTDILTGRTGTITPDDDATLADTSSTNPWNQHGIDHWDEIQLSTPSTAESATQLGRAALADRNTPKTPGTITVRGYIRDRAGHEQPVWKVRAGQTIALTNFSDDQPRLIVETDYNDEDKTLRIAVDRPFALLDAYLDRVGNALGARGLA